MVNEKAGNPTPALRSEGSATDAVLLQGVREGNVSAFEQIYYRWYGPLYGFVFNATDSVFDTERIAQEVFVRLWNMGRNIDTETDIRSLIFTIAYRTAVDIYRREPVMADTEK